MLWCFARSQWYHLAQGHHLLLPVYMQALLSNKLWRERRLSAIPELAQELAESPYKRLCSALRGNMGGLKEQLDAVVPSLPEEERFGATWQMINTWMSSGQQESCQLSPEVQCMYV